jgi:hypothetical protein
MSKRELSVVELQELINGFEIFSLDGPVINVHFDNHFVGFPIKGLYIYKNTDEYFDLRSSSFWLTYYKKWKHIHLSIM